MQKADSKGYAGTADDSGQNDEFTSVSQHSRKPNVVGLPSLSDKVTDEIFKDAPLINGYPAIKKVIWKMFCVNTDMSAFQ